MKQFLSLFTSQKLKTLFRFYCFLCFYVLCGVLNLKFKTVYHLRILVIPLLNAQVDKRVILVFPVFSFLQDSHINVVDG